MEDAKEIEREGKDEKDARDKEMRRRRRQETER